MSRHVKIEYFCRKLLKYTLRAEKNGCKCAESRLHTFSHSALDSLCTRGNGVNPVNTLIQHTIQLEKKYTTFDWDGSNIISYVANLWVPFDSACSILCFAKSLVRKTFMFEVLYFQCRASSVFVNLLLLNTFKNSQDGFPSHFLDK